MAFNNEKEEDREKERERDEEAIDSAGLIIAKEFNLIINDVFCI